jgi:hypothetical protein
MVTKSLIPIAKRIKTYLPMEIANKYPAMASLCFGIF